MHRSARKLVVAGVSLVGLACLLGGIALNLLFDCQKPAFMLGAAGVLIMLACAFVTSTLRRRLSVRWQTQETSKARLRGPGLRR